MNTLGLELIWWSIQATTFASAGLVVFFVARRGGPATGAVTASATLVILTGVSILALSPWPRWWTLAGPIRESVLQNATADAGATGASALPVEIGEVSGAGNPSGGREGAFTTPMADRAPGISVTEPPGSPWQALLDEMQPDRARLADGVSTWRWSGVAGLFFIVAAGIALVRFLLGLWVVHRYRVRSQPIIDPVLEEQVRQIAADMGFARPIEVRQSGRLGAPATIGWRRPLVLLPPCCKDWSDAERRVVLAHEIAHIVRGDYAAWLLAQACLAMHFYHPLVHWLVRRLRLEQELAADFLGAELSGGREIYLVTLTRMVLNKNAPTVAFAARPFLPVRGTFLRRIEMLSESKSLRRVSWTGRQIRSLVAALTVIGIAIAGVRMPSGDPIVAVAAGASRRAAGDDHTIGDTQPAKEVTKKEKPLTLDELRPLVVDQLRSIRSLYVGYSSIGPAEYGGQSREHVWAEQGFKMLKYDLPGNSTVPYASTFDGEQTYIGDFQGDKPVKAYAKDELTPGFHQSLQSTLLGWLHFGGTRESIADVIRAPTATLVEAAATDEAPGPTIEIKNYVQPASKALMDVTIVLDRAHDYLPRSIAYYSVANPSWKFAYEVDEFEKVRDGATGEARWFPTKGRYLQRTPERGEQVFTTTISKLQINDLLPDELFVLAPTTPAAAPGQEQQALAEFEKVYHLDPDQLVRRVKPPYLPGRMVNLKKWWAEAFAKAPYETSGTFLPMVYPERDGKLGEPGFHFTSGVDRAGIPAHDLLNGVGAALKLVPREVDDPEKLLEPMVEGDFVIRADAPAEKVIAALGQLLKTDCGIPVELELRRIEHPVVAIGGKINPPFIIDPDTVVELYVTEPQPNQGEIEQGTFSEFLQAVGRFIDPQRRIVNEVQNSPYRQEKISWHLAPGTEKNESEILGETTARAVLDHLERQTGLKFTLASRAFPTTFVRRSE